MSEPNRFTPEQWQLLCDVPAMVGAAVMVCGRSGLGTVREALSLTRELLQVPPEYERNQLIQAVVESRKSEDQDLFSWQNRQRDADAVAFAEATLACCAQGGELLQQVDSTEADGFKQWVLSIGQHVAEAASEQGLLGLGGPRVSPEEAQLLQAIAGALELPAR